jgi:hypothetical protein
MHKSREGNMVEKIEVVEDQAGERAGGRYRRGAGRPTDGGVEFMKDEVMEMGE